MPLFTPICASLLAALLLVPAPAGAAPKKSATTTKDPASLKLASGWHLDVDGTS